MKSARRWLVHGTVQGVGFRFFVQNKASEFGVHGWTRNLANGSVEVYGTGTPEQLSDLAAALHIGPSMAKVRRVDEREAAVEKCQGFSVR